MCLNASQCNTDGIITTLLCSDSEPWCIWLLLFFFHLHVSLSDGSNRILYTIFFFFFWEKYLPECPAKLKPYNDIHPTTLHKIYTGSILTIICTHMCPIIRPFIVSLLENTQISLKSTAANLHYENTPIEIYRKFHLTVFDLITALCA